MDASHEIKLGRALQNNVIRALLLGFPLVLLYYWNAAADWRYEVIRFPFHVRIWHTRGGCLPTDHYFLVDWPFSSVTLFLFLSFFSILLAIPKRSRKGAPRFPQISNN